jgi:CBS domain containing-hemolysin-like protein
MIRGWLIAAALLAQPAYASSEIEDTVAEVLAWVVMVVAPVIGIVAFWMVHILPEKIAEKRKHPQTQAIQVVCLLSLVFGGMLWPFAWLWAYTKPVMYKLAYGTDTVEHERGAPVPTGGHAEGDTASGGGHG